MSDEMITPQQLADKLQCSIRTVQNNVSSKKWPHLRLGPKLIRFTPEQVQGILDGSMVAAEVTRGKTARSERIRDLVKQLGEQQARKDEGPR